MRGTTQRRGLAKAAAAAAAAAAAVDAGKRLTFHQQLQVVALIALSRSCGDFGFDGKLFVFLQWLRHRFRSLTPKRLENCLEFEMANAKTV